MNTLKILGMREKLISEIIGMPVGNILFGPAGFTIDFGKEKKTKHFDELVTGEISVWVQCNALILFENQIVHRALYPQDKEEEEIFKKYLEGKTVMNAFIKEKYQSVHIEVDSGTMISVYPWSQESDKVWIIYDHRLEVTPGLITYSDSVKIVY